MFNHRHFNPDHYLHTSGGRVFTEERNAAAWRQLYLDLDFALRNSSDAGKLYVVCGIPGAGKSTWVRENIDVLDRQALFLDAALPKAEHRAQALAMAKKHGVKALGVTVSAPLEVAISRNSLRPQDERVPELTIRAVDSMFEPLAFGEGFDEIAVISSDLNNFAGPHIPNIEVM